MRTVPFLPIVTLLATAGAPAFGQQAPQPAADGTSGTLQEIVVTATKRRSPLQDVPVSVAVVSETTLEHAQIRDLIDLQSVVPSLKVQQLNAVGQTNFIIRGFGNGAGNDGIESSVGVFVDGVYRSRSASALNDLLDVQSIEVLRGPQSTLFGKNVSAGAIIITTVKPQFTFGTTDELTVSNYHGALARASVTGPISSTVAFRLSGSVDSRAGYLTNTTTGDDVNNRHRFSTRADLLWQPTDGVSVRTIADYNEISETCCGVVSLLNGPVTQLIGAPSPFGLGEPISNPATKFNNDIVFNTDPTNKIIGKGLSVQADWDAGFATLTSITAYRNEANRSIQDVDFTGADLANKDQPDSSGTFSQEFRLVSRGDQRLNWLLGAFFDDETLHTGVDTRFGTQIRPFADGLSGPSTVIPGASNLYTLEYLQSLVTPAIVPGATYFQPGQGISDFYRMYSRSFSIFGQVDFKVTSRLTVTGGLAYLNDHKRAISDVVLDDPFSALNLQDVPQLPYLGVPANAFGALGALQFFYGNTPNHAPVNFPNANESGVLDGSKATPTVRVAYDLGPVNAYLNFSRGWKAGAFNLSSDSRPPNVNGVGRTARPESVTLYEAGLKSRFSDGYLNLAIFDQWIDGFQVNDYTGTGYALVNAGKESVKGAELDSLYRPITWLTLTGSATYLDPKYDSYAEAPCVPYDTVNCPIDPLTGTMPNFRNLSGTKPAGVPPWSLSASATFSHDFADGYGTYLRAEYDFSSKVQLSETTPPAVSTFGQESVDVSAGLTTDHYELMLWARNLTDYRTIIAAFPTVAQTGSYSGFPNEPRTYGATIRMRF
ncbi:MAG: TonB-dependent receptor [Steroidobacteraceae bacterium]